MATIAATVTNGAGEVSLTETTLDGTLDTFVYKANSRQRLILKNDTAGALTPTIDGSGATTVSIAGAGSFDISGGYVLSEMEIGDVVSIETDTISKYLAGTIAITGGTGLTAILMEG